MTDNKKPFSQEKKKKDLSTPSSEFGSGRVSSSWPELSLSADLEASNESDSPSPDNKSDKPPEKKTLGKIDPKKLPFDGEGVTRSKNTEYDDSAPETSQPEGGEGDSGGPDQGDIEYMSPVRASYMRQPKRRAPILLYSIGAFFICAFIWASFAELDEVTRGEGRVVPSGQVKTIDHLEGGIVKNILIRDGDIVEKGQVLLEIDSTVAKARYEEGLSMYYQSFAQIVRVKAQLAGEEFIIPEEVLKNAPEIAAKEKDTYESSVKRLNNEKEIATREVEQREQERIEAQFKVEQLQNRLSLAEEELKLTEPLVNSGIAPKVDWIRIKRDINDTKGELAGAKSNVPRTEAAYLQAKQKLDQVVVNFHTDWYKELQEAERRWAEIKDATTTGLDRITRTEVRSPVRGTIKELKVNTIGSVVQPGEDLVDIVPLEDTLLIEAQVRPSDVAFLRPGMPAVIKITAYDFSIYGGLDATLVDISAGTIIEEKPQQQKAEQEFFRIRLRTDKNYLGTEANPLPISPGMTAQVDILTGKKTVWQYIIKPILRAKENALTER